MKKVILPFVVLLASINASAADTVTIDGVVYSLSSDYGTAAVTKGNGFEGKELHLPATIDYEGRTYSLNTISSRAFKDCKSIEKIVTEWRLSMVVVA